MRTLHTIAMVVSLVANAIPETGLQAARAEHSESAPVAAFDREMAESMSRMHAAMDLRPSGDPDRDFAAMMIPHHQGAIDMARAELAYGRDPVLRRLAQGILVEQTQEIDVMQRALADLPSPPATASEAATETPSGHRHDTDHTMKAK